MTTAFGSLSSMYIPAIGVWVPGYISDSGLRSALQRVGFALSPQHRTLLFQQWGTPRFVCLSRQLAYLLTGLITLLGFLYFCSGFNYREFVEVVYPSNEETPRFA